MSVDTGNLSLWLCATFTLVSLIGVIAIFLIIKNKSIENENIDRLIELGKWFIASVAITLSASIINDGFRERDQDIKEIEVFDKYVTNVLEVNGLEKKKLLCEYFVAVSPSGDIKKSWQRYEKIIDEHINEDKKANAALAIIESKEQKGEATPEDRKEKNILAEQIETRNSSFVASVKVNQKSAEARIFIHISEEYQRPTMVKLQKSLNDMGFITPGIENVKGKAQIPANPNVRYFNDEDESQAKIIADQLKNLGFTTAYPYRVRSSSARLGTLEVWLSNK